VAGPAEPTERSQCAVEDRRFVKTAYPQFDPEQVEQTVDDMRRAREKLDRGVPFEHLAAIEQVLIAQVDKRAARADRALRTQTRLSTRAEMSRRGMLDPYAPVDDPFRDEENDPWRTLEPRE
jgi:hypothetical protein